MAAQIYRRALGILIVICGLAAVGRSAPLADRLPADALVYIGWAGSQSLGSSYDPSNLRQVLDQSGLQQFLQQAIPNMIQQASAQNPAVAGNLQTLLAAAGPLWRHPSALYIGPVDFGAMPPTVRLALVCDAGGEAAALSAQWDKLLASAPPVGPPRVNKTYGSLVVLSLGMVESQVDAAFSAAPASPLSGAAGFTAAAQQVAGDAPAVVYLDLQGLVKVADQAVPLIQEQSGNPRLGEIWSGLRDALNLGALRQAIFSSGFDGKDWSSQCFVGTDGSTTGVAGMLAAQPLDDAVLAVAPQSCSRFFAGRLDLAGVLKGIRWAVGAIDPDTGQQFDQALAKVNLVLGLDLQHDLLESLGDQWAGYSDRAIGGPGLLGGVLVNRLRDPARADAALRELAQRANAIMGEQMHDSPIRLQFVDTSSDGITVHHLAMPFVAPAWAVKDGNLYLSLYPQIINAAARFVASGAPSIAQNPQFMAVMHRLGDHKPASVSFLDLPVTAPEAYGDALAMSQVYLGLAEMAGGTTTTPVLPPLDKLLPYLAPAGAVSWSDSAGWHSRSISPFPLSETLGAGGAGSTFIVGESALMTSILLPSLNRARETANRVKCASNERQIGQGILLYSNDNKGNYPPDLGTLINTEDLTAEVFICPSSNTQVPPNFATFTPQQKADWVNHSSDYIYIGQGLNNQAPADRVVMYEKDDDHDHDGMNILYGDGHVEFQTLANAHQQINKATGGAGAGGGPPGEGNDGKGL